MLVGQVLKRVDHPTEAGVWFEFRRLPWRKLEEARRATQIDGASLAKAYGAELVGMMQKQTLTPELLAAVEAEKAQRRGQYDTGVLLRAGIKTWSYGQGHPTPDEVDDLDEDTASWAREQILDLSIVSRSEDERKNG
jgi:hypothetical protein